MSLPPSSPPPTAVEPGLSPQRRRFLLYAERPGRRILQVVADLSVLIWVVLVSSAATALYDVVLALQAPGRGLTEAGTRVTGVFDGAAETASGVPFVGDDLAGALAPGANAGDALADAGRAQVEAVGTIATGLAWLVVVVVAVPVVLVWLALRVRWVLKTRHALAARALDVDLLALRALTGSSPARIRRALGPGGDAAGAWRRGDPAVLMRLADVELGRMGLRGPMSVTSSGLPSPRPGGPRDL